MILSAFFIEIASKAFTGIIVSTSTPILSPLLKDKTQPLLNKAGEISDAFYNLVSGASKKYIENYSQRHGCLKVLGMNKEVSLDDIYINVNFKQDTIASYQTIDNIEKIFRDRDCRDEDKRNALEVANQEARLMVLGHPGSQYCSVSGKNVMVRLK